MTVEREVIEAIISIDTSYTIGSTSVYGQYEVERIIQDGARANGYKAIIASDSIVTELQNGTRVERWRSIITLIHQKEDIGKKM